MRIPSQVNILSALTYSRFINKNHTTIPDESLNKILQSDRHFDC